MVLNVEASRYANMRRGRLDIEMDKMFMDRGDYLFEKMVSGKYLGLLCMLLLKDAANDGLFTPSFVKSIQQLKRIETKDLSDYYRCSEDSLLMRFSDQATDQKDREVFSALIGALINRAALYCTIAISAFVLKSNPDTDKSVGIMVEGGTFYNLSPIRAEIQNSLEMYLKKMKKINYDLITVDNAVLTGAAMAAFCE
jgi:hexokinase